MILLVLLFVLAIPAVAEAGVVRVQDGAVVYVGDASNETVELARARDPEAEPERAYQLVVGTASTAEAPCTKEPDDIFAFCPSSVGELPVRLIGASGDDTLSVQVNPGAINVPVTLDGGDGNDRLNGAYEATTLLGGPGDDLMAGDFNRSRGVDADGRGPDVFQGGDGVDRVSYFNHKVNAVTVTIDGVADDGAPGEGDNVMTDVENLEGLIGGSSNFTGSAGPNELLGSNAGADTLRGGGGNDRLLGVDGADTLEGGDGDDYLEGGFGDDRLVGGAGLDSFIGDRTERNVIGVGNDTILARDGVAEPIACWPGLRPRRGRRRRHRGHRRRQPVRDRRSPGRLGAAAAGTSGGRRSGVAVHQVDAGEALQVTPRAHLGHLPRQGRRGLQRDAAASAREADARLAVVLDRARTQRPHLDHALEVDGAPAQALAAGHDQRVVASGRPERDGHAHAAPLMPAYAAFLRGINLGSHKRVKMPELRAALEAVGYEDVQTHLQSGNVVLRTDDSPETVAARVTEASAVDAETIVRTAAQMRAIVDGNPFAPVEDGKLVHVAFLAGPAAEIELDPEDFAPEAWAARGMDVYFHLPGGMGRSKLMQAMTPKRYGASATLRNWNTVTAVTALLDD